MRLQDQNFGEAYIFADGTGEFRMAGQLTEIGQDFADDLAELAAKLISRLDEDELAIIHDGISYRGARIDAITGYCWCLRRQEAEIRDISTIGFRPDFLHKVGAVAKARGHGLILIAGETNSGKTSTTGSILQYWQQVHPDIAVLLENPPELKVGGKSGRGRYFQIHAIDDKFAEQFAHVLRWTVRYLMIGEIRTMEAARLAIHAAMAGHLVVATIHAGSITQAMMLLLEKGEYADPDQAATLMADSLIAVVHQRLTSGIRPHAEVSTLFVDSDAIRAKIRGRQLGHLKDEINQQAARKG